jgi:hypothetical protein
MDGRVGQAKEQGVAEVQFGGDESVAEKDAGVMIKRWTNLADLANEVKGGTADGGDVFSKREVAIKENTEVFNRFGRKEGVTVEGNGGGNDLGPLLLGADEKKFSFGGVENKSISGQPGVNRVKNRGKVGQGSRLVSGGERDIELSVVGVKMKRGWGIMEKVRKGGGVHSEKKRAQNRPLRNTCQKRGREGDGGIDADRLGAVQKVGRDQV